MKGGDATTKVVKFDWRPFCGPRDPRQIRTALLGGAACLQKRRGIDMLDEYVQRSNTMLVLWGEEYSTRLFCVLEVARRSAHTRTHSQRPHTRAATPVLTPTVRSHSAAI